MNFYSIIIGTELLNGRRVDKHFEFLNNELNKRGLTHFASFVIKDDVALIENTFKTILQDKDAVLFCFGGIGATPDDLTREIAAKVFTSKPLALHVEAKRRIEKQFGSEAYPHRINMAMLPEGAKLLDNVVNNVPGFYLEKRYFFTPGFPSMAWPMITWALDNIFEGKQKPYSYNFIAESGENDLIDMMQLCPQNIDLSSLPRFVGEKRRVEMYLSSYDKEVLDKYYNEFIAYLRNKGISYSS